MQNYRIYVEKLERFQVEAQSLKADFNLNLGLNLKSLRLINVYDLFGFSEALLEKCKYQVFGEVVTDNVFNDLNLDGLKYLAIEFLPGQFDQRASSAIACVGLIDPNQIVNIKSSKIIIFDNDLKEEELLKIKKYYINAIESREKNLSILSDNEQADIVPVKKLDGFRDLKATDLEKYCKEQSLAMNKDDLACVVNYFNEENRDPYETELKILDTYWSDHCRHTTFNTEITDIEISESFIKNELEESLDLYYKIRKELNRENKTLCLMDLACIGARYLKKQGYLNDLEESEENNACSIFVTVDVDGVDEKWLLQFKNETHNHPTEIEPFGGASTCLGGAIRDPLSGRSYVYQAMRVTGAGNIYLDVKDTMEGKLPQRIISTKACAGYSSYGNQIGLATTHVREIYHDNYVAKRLEVGAVVGAVKASDIRRESPEAGDIILLLGGQTGRDGIGGATGSSKEHTMESLEVCSSEVQKGNAPEERKIARLFRKKEVTKLIKKSNDFGAGGVSVAIGELADGLEIYLDKVPTKYKGLNSTELAISESQERMAVVVEAKDVEEFIKYCAIDNIEVTEVAKVTNQSRLVMYNKGEKIVDIKRSFIDSAGAMHYAKAKINEVSDVNPFNRNIDGDTLVKKIHNNLEDNNVVSQKGLIENFDATIGVSTVLMPFGGKNQTTETQVSVQKLPVLDGFTNTASIMAFGYNPFITSWSPYHGAMYAVIEACAKVVSAGADYSNMRFSYQEYFEKMSSDSAWGKPLAALLGTLKMQVELKLPSIGGKDSMSGTFGNISVPPTLIAFGITTVNAKNVISPEFKKSGNYVYLLKHTPNPNYTPNTEELTRIFNFTTKNILDKNIISAYSVGFGGVAEAICKMSFGNEIGANINIDEKELFNYNYGSIVVESTIKLEESFALYLGETINDNIIINNEVFNILALQEINANKFRKVYRDSAQNTCKAIDYKPVVSKTTNLKNKDEVNVYIPVFPGTNCDYDTAKAFKRAGGVVKTSIFRNLTAKDIMESIDEMASSIDNCDIFVLSGGFSAGDEPDGSGKFIACTLNNEKVSAAIERLIARKGLILGICNGFQALVKSGLLPYGHLNMINEESPTLFRNDINRHISQMVDTKVISNKSPWLQSFKTGEVHTIALSHGEGKFVMSDSMARELFNKGQVAFIYVDKNEEMALDCPYNPNGSSFAIEGIISEDGLVLGKMGHTERYEDNLYKNISGNMKQELFDNAIKYFKK